MISIFAIKTKPMEENGSAAMLAAKRSAGVAPEVKLKEGVTHMCQPSMNKAAHPGFGISVSPQKGLVSTKIKKNTSPEQFNCFYIEQSIKFLFFPIFLGILLFFLFFSNFLLFSYFLAILLTISKYFRVAMAQGKQGIWFLLFPDRENTGNFAVTQGKFLRHRENILFWHREKFRHRENN